MLKGPMDRDRKTTDITDTTDGPPVVGFLPLDVRRPRPSASKKDRRVHLARHNQLQPGTAGQLWVRSPQISESRARAAEVPIPHCKLAGA